MLCLRSPDRLAEIRPPTDYLRNLAQARHMVWDDRDSQWEQFVSRHMLSPTFLTLTENTVWLQKSKMCLSPQTCHHPADIQEIRLNPVLGLPQLSCVLTVMDLSGCISRMNKSTFLPKLPEGTFNINLSCRQVKPQVFSDGLSCLWLHPCTWAQSSVCVRR